MVFRFPLPLVAFTSRADAFVDIGIIGSPIDVDVGFIMTMTSVGRIERGAVTALETFDFYWRGRELRGA